MLRSIRDPQFLDTLGSAGQRKTIQVDLGGQVRSVETPFASPEDWRDRWIYFLMVDRFNNPSGGPRAGWDDEVGSFQGGTLEGVRKGLGYLQSLGVGAIWLSPILKNCPWEGDSHHGYGIHDFLQIDPRFTFNPVAARNDPSLGERELRALVDEAHARGMHVILDIVLNHGGNVFSYVGHGSDAPWKGQGPEYDVRWRDENGNARFADVGAIPATERPDHGIVWPRELQRNDFWRRRGKDGDNRIGDFASLKELVTEYLAGDGSFPVREVLIRVLHRRRVGGSVWRPAGRAGRSLLEVSRWGSG